MALRQVIEVLDFFQSITRAESLRLVSSAITWVIIVGGWIVVNRQSNNRELRKELRSEIDSIKEEVEEIVLMALSYHMESPSKESAFKLLGKLKRLNRKIFRLPLSEVEISSISYYSRKLKQGITMQNFGIDEKVVRSLGYDSEIVGGIENGAEDLVDDLERAFSIKCRTLSRF